MDDRPSGSLNPTAPVRSRGEGATSGETGPHADERRTHHRCLAAVSRHPIRPAIHLHARRSPRAKVLRAIFRYPRRLAPMHRGMCIYIYIDCAFRRFFLTLLRLSVRLVEDGLFFFSYFEFAVCSASFLSWHANLMYLALCGWCFDFSGPFSRWPAFELDARSWWTRYHDAARVVPSVSPWCPLAYRPSRQMQCLAAGHNRNPPSG